MKNFLILIPLNLILLALHGLAESTPPEPVPISGGGHPLEAAMEPTADKPALLWRDATSKRILFTSKDIISFDWEKQVFLLKADATLDFLAWIPPHVHQARELILEDVNGPIYEAHWVNHISSLGFTGPVYNALSPNPFLSIENGYPSRGNAAGRDTDARFSPRMRAGLEKSGVLESIDLTKEHVGLAVQTTGNEWMNTGEDMKVRVTYFNDTFRIGRKARAHVFFAGGEKTRTRVDSLTLEIKFLANNGTLRTDNKIEKIPISAISEGIYVCEFDPWLATKGSDKQAEPGTGVVSLTVLLQKKEGEHERTVYRLDFEEKHVPIGGRIEAEQTSSGDSSPRATATEGVRIELSQRADEPRYVELTLHNDSKEVVELEIPVEGAGDCYRYFEIEAVTLDGAPVQKHTLYAPFIPPYVVKLKPGGIYIHRIQPGAYPNATEVQKLRKLRVKYTNPLTAAAIVSDWLDISQK